MGITINWGNDEHTLIYIAFDPQWTWREFEALDDQTTATLDSVDHKVNFIVDASNGNRLPRGLPTAQIKQVIKLEHPNSNRMVLVGANTYVRVMLDTALKIISEAGGKIIFAHTIEEARRILAEEPAP